MITTVQTKNEHTLETYPEAPMPSDLAQKESRWHINELKRWAWNLGRFVAANGHPYVAGMQMLDKAVSQQTLSAATRHEMAHSYLSGSKHFKIPPDGIEQIGKMVEAHIKYWGPILAPRWCKLEGDAYVKLYLAVLIYGANGREFPMATQRTAAGLKVSWRAVQDFLVDATDSCLEKPLIEIIQRGLQYGKKRPADCNSSVKHGSVTVVRLQREYFDMWKKISPAPNNMLPPNDENRIPFAKYLENHVPWCVNDERIAPVPSGECDLA